MLADVLLRVGVSKPALAEMDELKIHGNRELGGPVSSGRMYRVNEKHPELLNVGGKQYLMMGGQSGSVTPNAAPAKGGNTYNMTIQVAPPPGTSRETASQMGLTIGRQIQHSMRRNG